jgi:multiple sugar transport system permease protein
MSLPIRSGSTVQSDAVRRVAGVHRGKQRTVSVQTWWSRNQVRVIPYIFIAPNLVLLTTFMFGPILAAIVISFYKWNIIGVPQFTGLANYARLIEDPLFRTALVNTSIYTLGTVPTSMALGLGAALLLNRPLPGRTALRGVYFAPMVISGVATGLIAAWMFNDNYGIINAFLRAVGLDPIRWLSSPTWSMVAVIIATIWIRLGLSMVVYLAGLQAIPETYYDAAKVDGASAWQRFRYVTLPLLGPTTFLLVVINVIFSFKAFDLIFAMTGGGPGFSTTVLVLYIYQTAFQRSDMGYASTMGVVLYAIVTTFMVLQWRLSRKAETYGG